MRIYQHRSSGAERQDGIDGGREAAARVLLLGQESIYPGWYMQRYVDGILESTRLEIRADSKAVDAVVAAADRLNCPIRKIQVSGPEWPLYPEKD